MDVALLLLVPKSIVSDRTEFGATSSLRQHLVTL